MFHITLKNGKSFSCETNDTIFEGAKNTFSIPVPITYMVAMMIAATELFSIAENVKRITGVELGTLISRFFKR